MSGRFRAVVLTLAAATVVALPSLALTAAPASAAADPEQVVSDSAALTLGTDGVLTVTETIVYNFTGGGSINRDFVTQAPVSDTQDREYRLQDVQAASTDGGPTQVSVSTGDDHTTLHVSGASDLHGRHTVTLGYQVLGAAQSTGGLLRVHWSAVGGWDVPVRQAAATLTGPDGAQVRALSCVAGAPTSLIGCSRFYLDGTGRQAGFALANMLSGDYLTITVDFPSGVAQGQPILVKRHTLSTAFTVNSKTGGALLALLVLLLGGFGVLYQLRGRDARTATRRAAARPQPGDAGFVPPAGRPGQIGTLIDEQADEVDVAATIVDLAVRGYLLIQEEDDEETGVPGWRLLRLERPSNDLLAYERLLYGALFNQRNSVLIGELSGSFAGDLPRIRDALYRDVVSQGWFNARPDEVRNHWTIGGAVITAVGVAGTIALAVYTELALVGLAVVIAGIGITIGGRFMPSKTSRGAEVVAYTDAFRVHLQRGETPPNLAPPQRLALYSRFLPYAVVFDCIGPWTKTVQDAGFRGAYGDNLYWYRGSAAKNLPKFDAAVRGFTKAASTAISMPGPRARAHA